MGAAAGEYQLGPGRGRLLVKTGRTGLGARAGHDLTIEVGRWRGQAVIDPAHPENCRVRVEADVESFEVIAGTGGVKPLTSGDRAEIRRTLRDKILHAGRHPVITFTSSR